MGCAPDPFGASSEERLASAMGDTSSADSGDELTAEDLAALQQYACGEAAGRLEKANTAENESEKLTMLVNLVRTLRADRQGREAIFDRRPGLRYHQGVAADGMTYDIPSLETACKNAISGAEDALDDFLRDLISGGLVIEEYKKVGRKRTSVASARVDFAKVREAIDVLAPTDSDALYKALRQAEERLKEN